MRDPVCDMDVDEVLARQDGLMTEYDGKQYVFCSAGCKREFDNDPEMFATPDIQGRSEEDGMGGYPSSGE